MAISMLKIRRPIGRLIFNMGMAIPGKTVFLIETAPRARQSATFECNPCAFVLISLERKVKPHIVWWANVITNKFIANIAGTNVITDPPNHHIRATWGMVITKTHVVCWHSMCGNTLSGICDGTRLWGCVNSLPLVPHIRVNELDQHWFK